MNKPNKDFYEDKSVIQWLTSKTGVDMHYVTRGGFWLTAQALVTIFVSLALSVAFANLLLPSEYGQYKFIIAIFAFANAFSLTGFSTSLIRAAAKGFDKTLVFLFFRSLYWSIIPTTILVATSLYYFSKENYETAFAIFITALMIGVYVSSYLYSDLLMGKKMFRTGFVYESTTKVAVSAALLVALFAGYNLIILVAIYFGLATLLRLFFYFITVHKHVEPTTSSLEAASFGYHLSFMNILNRLAAAADKILIFHYLGAVQLAIYSFAGALPDQIKNLNGVIRGLLLPKLSSMTPMQMKKSLPRKVLLFTSIMTAVVFLYIAAAPYIFNLFFPQYTDSIIYSQILALPIIITAPTLVFNSVLQALARHRDLYYSKIISPIVRIILLFLLVPALGVWGVIAAIIATHSINFTILLIQFIRLPVNQLGQEVR